MNFAIFLLVVCLVAVDVMGGPPEGFERQEFHIVHDKCLAENGMEDETFRAIMEQEKVTDEKAKCVVACIAKSVGIMTEDGTVDKEKFINRVPSQFSEEEKEKMRRHNAECAKTTGESVCDTAYLLHKCQKPEEIRIEHGRRHH